MHTMIRDRVVFVFAVMNHVVWVGSTTQKGVTYPSAMRGIIGRVWVVYIVTCSGHYVRDSALRNGSSACFTGRQHPSSRQSARLQEPNLRPILPHKGYMLLSQSRSNKCCGSEEGLAGWLLLCTFWQQAPRPKAVEDPQAVDDAHTPLFPVSILMG